MGKPDRANLCHPQGREPGELKHLSSPRKRDHSASSGERKRNSPVTQQGNRQPKRLEKRIREGDSPVGESGQPGVQRVRRDTLTLPEDGESTLQG
jgi:hypothetical protein